MLGERWVARPTRLLTVFHRAARSYAYSLCARSARIYVGAAPASPAGSVPASSPPGARTSSSGGSEASDRAGRQQKLSFTRWACCCGCCCGSCCGSQAQLQCSWMSSLPARVPGTPHCTSEIRTSKVGDWAEPCRLEPTERLALPPHNACATAATQLQKIKQCRHVQHSLSSISR